VSGDKGWGLTQLTPRVWKGRIGESWKRLMSRLGGLHQMLNPVKNLVVARRMFLDAGWSPWKHSRYLTASERFRRTRTRRSCRYRGRHGGKFKPHLSRRAAADARPQARDPAARPALVQPWGEKAAPTGLESGAGHIRPRLGRGQRHGAVTVDTNGDGEPDFVNKHGWKDPRPASSCPASTRPRRRSSG
jgi:hypothetical protein